ncbi:MAG: energy transducer TonB [Pseudomonadota bacterium]
MIAKQAAAGALALASGFALFFLMILLIRSDGILEKPDRNRSYLNFIRVDPADDDISTKDRRLPEPPPPPEEPPETPDFSTQIDQVSANMNMDMPSIGVNVGQGDGAYLGTLQQGQGLAGFDTDVIPVVRVPPTYPRRAKVARISGKVIMAVTIRPDGTVADAEVLESEPPRMFDDAALTAMRRWKFRPKIVDGTPVAQRARQTIEFKLN